MKPIVQLDKNNHVFTTTLIISDGVCLDHKVVMNLLRKYSNTETLKTFKKASEKRKGSKGKPVIYAELSELQSTFLITLMKNSDIVIKFKKSFESIMDLCIIKLWIYF